MKSRDGVATFTIRRLRGSGSFGNVYEAESHNGERVAIKISKMTVNDIDQDKYKEVLLREMESPSWNLKHPRLCPPVSCFVNTHEHYVIVMALQHKSMEDFQPNEENTTKLVMPQQCAARFAIQLLQGVTFLQDISLIHRDLKPANLLMTCDDLYRSRIQICDFGLAKKLGTGGQTVCGTDWYKAPEVLNKEPNPTVCDSYSVGMIIHDFLEGKKPPCTAYRFAHDEKYRAKIPFNVTKNGEAQALVEGLLRNAPARDSLRTSMKNKFLSDCSADWNTAALYAVLKLLGPILFPLLHPKAFDFDLAVSALWYADAVLQDVSSFSTPEHALSTQLRHVQKTIATALLCAGELVKREHGCPPAFDDVRVGGHWIAALLGAASEPIFGFLMHVDEFCREISARQVVLDQESFRYLCLWAQNL